MNISDCYFHDPVDYIVNPKKKYTCQEVLRMVKWAQIHNQGLVAIADRNLSHILHFRKKPQTGLSTSCIVLLPSESTIITEFLVLSFHQWTETALILSELYNYLLICICAD